MGDRVRRPEDDHGTTRSSHPPLPYPRNRKRQLPLQKQLSESAKPNQGATAKLDEPPTHKHHQPGSVLNGNPGSNLSGNRQPAPSSLRRRSANAVEPGSSSPRRS